MAIPSTSHSIIFNINALEFFHTMKLTFFTQTHLQLNRVCYVSYFDESTLFSIYFSVPFSRANIRCKRIDLGLCLNIKSDEKRLNFDLWIAVSLITMLFLQHFTTIFFYFFYCTLYVWWNRKLEPVRISSIFNSVLSYFTKEFLFFTVRKKGSKNIQMRFLQALFYA